MATVIPSNKVKEMRARHSVTQLQLAEFLEIGVMNLRRKEKMLTLWKEDEMHLVVYFFNNYFGEHFKLEDIFTCEVLEL